MSTKTSKASPTFSSLLYVAAMMSTSIPDIIDCTVTKDFNTFLVKLFLTQLAINFSPVCQRLKARTQQQQNVVATRNTILRREHPPLAPAPGADHTLIYRCRRQALAPTDLRVVHSKLPPSILTQYNMHDVTKRPDDTREGIQA